MAREENPYEPPPDFDLPPAKYDRPGRPRHLVALLFIGAASFGLAKLIGPNAPYAVSFLTFFLFVFGAITYVVGVANGHKAARRE